MRLLPLFYLLVFVCVCVCLFCYCRFCWCCCYPRSAFNNNQTFKMLFGSRFLTPNFAVLCILSSVYLYSTATTLAIAYTRREFLYWSALTNRDILCNICRAFDVHTHTVRTVHIAYIQCGGAVAEKYFCCTTNILSNIYAFYHKEDVETQDIYEMVCCGGFSAFDALTHTHIHIHSEIWTIYTINNRTTKQKKGTFATALCVCTAESNWKQEIGHGWDSLERIKWKII